MTVLKSLRLSDWLCLLSMVLFLVGLSFGSYDFDRLYGWNIHKLYNTVYFVVMFISCWLSTIRRNKDFIFWLSTISYCGILFMWGLFSVEVSRLMQTIAATLGVTLVTIAFVVNRFG